MFDPAKLTEHEADHYATVAFDGNLYSVPVELAGEYPYGVRLRANR